MNKYKKSSLISLSAPILFWLGGYDFNERGGLAVLMAILMMAIYIFSITCPYWED